MSLRTARHDIRTLSQLLTRAESEARADGLREPGAEHLALAALGMPDGTAARAFSAVGRDEADLRTALSDDAAQALARVGVVAPSASPREPAPAPSGPYRARASQQELFQAAKRAAAGRHEPLLSAHVLEAAAESDVGTLARALKRLGVDRTELAAAAQAAAQAAAPGSR